MTIPAREDSDYGKQPDPCWCYACDGSPNALQIVHMYLCPTCGNKRCPRAADHRLPCTGSNEPGRPGSAYSDVSAADALRLLDETEER